MFLVGTDLVQSIGLLFNKGAFYKVKFTWLEYIRDLEMRFLQQCPEDHETIGAMMSGFPAALCLRSLPQALDLLYLKLTVPQK